VLTSETLRNEVIDLYTSKTTPVNTILMVTHSISEGVFMATRLVVMGAHRARFAPCSTTRSPTRATNITRNSSP